MEIGLSDEIGGIRVPLCLMPHPSHEYDQDKGFRAVMGYLLVTLKKYVSDAVDTASS